MKSTKQQRALRAIKLSFVTLLSVMVLISNLPGFANANVHVLGNVYFVAPDGSDDNDGSEQAPWRSIQHAANTVKPGDTVLVREGIYKESITIRNSGSPSLGYITIQAYPNETPIISGEGSTESSLVQFYNAHYVIFDGFELTNLRTSDSSKYLSGIKILDASSNITIQNNHLHAIEHTGSKGNANGIIVYGNSRTPIKNIDVVNNYLHDLVLGSSEALTVVGNVDGFRVEGNTIERVNNIGIDVAGFFGTCSSGCTDQARNGVVAGNKVSYVDTITNPAYNGHRAAAAIYVDGGTNTVIERNEVSYSNFGFEIASENSGKAATKITLRNNYIHHNHMAGLIMGGSLTSNGAAKENIIINNTFYNNNQLRTGYGEITFQNYVQQNIFVNNIFVASSVTPYFYDTKTSNSENIMNYNLYAGIDKTSTYWTIGGSRFESIGQYQKATGQDGQSIVANPNFRSDAMSEIELSVNSPAIDAGTILYKQYGEVDYQGDNRVVGSSIDIGATEFAGLMATPMPTVEPTATISPTAEPTATISPTVEPTATISPTAEPTATIMPTVEPTATITPTVEPTATITPTVEPTATITPTTTPTTTITPTTTPTRRPTPAPSEIPIIIDGLDKEWQSYPKLATSNSNTKAMKAFIKQRTLYVLIEGQLLKEKGQLYISSNQDDKSYFEVPYWSNQQADYLIENGILYQYSGSGSDWKWSKLKDYRKESVAINNSIIELAIPLSDLSSQDQGELHIGYIWKDSKSNQLPLGGAMAKVTVAPNENHPEPPATPSPPPTPAPIIIIDGKLQDWSSSQAISINSDQSLALYASSDDEYLYFAIQSRSAFKKAQVYLNTDQQSSTGYQSSRWKGSGVDYLIEDGFLYRYIGDNRSWAFHKQAAIDRSSYASSSRLVEMRISLTALGVRRGESITIGVMLDDQTSLKLPQEGSFVPYSLR